MKLPPIVLAAAVLGACATSGVRVPDESIQDETRDANHVVFGLMSAINEAVYNAHDSLLEPTDCVRAADYRDRADALTLELDKMCTAPSSPAACENDFPTGAHDEMVILEANVEACFEAAMAARIKRFLK